MFRPMMAIMGQNTTNLLPHTHTHTQGQTQYRRPSEKEHDHHWDSQQDFNELNFFYQF
jgi:hypothetical protein